MHMRCRSAAVVVTKIRSLALSRFVIRRSSRPHPLLNREALLGTGKGNEKRRKSARGPWPRSGDAALSPEMGWTARLEGWGLARLWFFKI
jgi:hypothetical protein